MKDIFKEKGLQKVSLPRQNIAPLNLLQYNGHGQLEIIGKVTEVFVSGTVSLSIPKENEPVTEWSTNSIVETDLKSSFTFLQGIWNRLGKGELSGSYKSDDTVIFDFKNILKDSIASEIELNNYLYTAIVNNNILESYKDKFNKGELYVITYILKSADFQIKIIDKLSQEAKLDAKIKEIINANINIGQSNDASESLKSNGEKLVFAVRVKKIFYDKGNWFKERSFQLRDSSKGNVLGLEHFTSTDLHTENGYVDFIDPKI